MLFNINVYRSTLHSDLSSNLSKLSPCKTDLLLIFRRNNYEPSSILQTGSTQKLNQCNTMVFCLQFQLKLYIIQVCCVNQAAIV